MLVKERAGLFLILPKPGEEVVTRRSAASTPVFVFVGFCSGDVCLRRRLLPLYNAATCHDPVFEKLVYGHVV